MTCLCTYGVVKYVSLQIISTECCYLASRIGIIFSTNLYMWVKEACNVFEHARTLIKMVKRVLISDA